LLHKDTFFKGKKLIDFTQILLVDLLISVSFLGNIYIRKSDSLSSADGVGGFRKY
jgi:hypothetical protein